LSYNNIYTKEDENGSEFQYGISPRKFGFTIATFSALGEKAPKGNEVGSV
jgi:hypothetical protein